MMARPDPVPISRSPERQFRASLEDLASRNAALVQVMGPFCGPGAPVEPGPAALIGLRASLADERIELLVRWVDWLSRRLVHSERQWQLAIERLGRHEDTLELIAAALRDLDDPYGFGERLDERIAADRDHGDGREDAGGVCDVV